jgi:IS605 OrfB family transposase
VTPSRQAPDATEPDGGTLGVDLGIVNLAPDSDGAQFTGALSHVVRNRYHLPRQRLQKGGTSNAKRRIRRMGQHEARFQRDTTHCLSKRLVQKAAVARKARAREDLSGLRERTPVRRDHRYERHAWAFFHLRHYSADTAAQAGVPVHVVDPRTTSRTWSHCGHCEKANRTSQAELLCQRCGIAWNADYTAALTSSRHERAAVHRPLASPLAGEMQAPGLSRGVVDRTTLSSTGQAAQVAPRRT